MPNLKVDNSSFGFYSKSDMALAVSFHMRQPAGIVSFQRSPACIYDWKTHFNSARRNRLICRVPINFLNHRSCPQLKLQKRKASRFL